MTRRESILFAGALVALFVGLLMSFQTLRGSAATAVEARDRSRNAEALAAQIESLREERTIVATSVPDASVQTGSISAAAAAAGLPETSVERIDPEPARRFANTAYQEFPVRVRLRNLSVGQFLTFVRASESDPSVRVTSFRLTAPRDDAGPDHWAVDLTLSRLFYSPVRRGPLSQP